MLDADKIHITKKVLEIGNCCCLIRKPWTEGEKIMDKGRFGSMVTALGRCELTYLEKQFVGRIEEYFEENGMLTEQQESILEGIYRGKIRWTKKRARRDEAYSTKSSS